MQWLQELLSLQLVLFIVCFFSTICISQTMFYAFFPLDENAFLIFQPRTSNLTYDATTRNLTPNLKRYITKQ